MNAKPQSKSMLEAILETPSDKEIIEQGLLPESCAFHLETALTFARKTASATNYDDAMIFNKTVVEHLEEIKEKIKKAQA